MNQYRLSKAEIASIEKEAEGVLFLEKIRYALKCLDLSADPGSKMAYLLPDGTLVFKGQAGDNIYAVSIREDGFEVDE